MERLLLSGNLLSAGLDVVFRLKELQELFLKEAVKNFPSLFEGTGSGSGKGPEGHRRSGDKTLTRQEFNALGPNERAAKMKDGFKVVD